MTAIDNFNNINNINACHSNNGPLYFTHPNGDVIVDNVMGFVSWTLVYKFIMTLPKSPAELPSKASTSESLNNFNNSQV